MTAVVEIDTTLYRPETRGSQALRRLMLPLNRTVVVLKLFLKQISDRRQCSITRLKFTDLVADEVLAFLQSLEAQRGNQVRTRNQQLAALRTFFRYLASLAPEMLAEAERVEAIPTKRCPPPPTYLPRA